MEDCLKRNIMNENLPDHIGQFRPSGLVTDDTCSWCAETPVVGREQSLVIGHSADLGPQGLEDMQVPTARTEEGDHGKLHTLSDFLLTFHGTKPSHVVVIKGTTTPIFD